MIRIETSQNLEKVRFRAEPSETLNDESIADVKKNSTSMDFISFVRKLFYLYGLDIANGHETSNKPGFFDCFSFRILFWNLWCLMLFLKTILSGHFLRGEAYAKISLMVALRDILSIILWYGLFFKRQSLFKMLSSFAKESEKVQVVLPKRYFLASSTCILLVVAVGMVTFVTRRECRSFLFYFTLQLVNIDNCTLTYMLKFSYYLLILALHACVSAFYILLCMLSQKFLQKHLEAMQISIRDENKMNAGGAFETNSVFEQYEDTLLVLKAFEESMSFFAFLLQMQNFCNAFKLLISIVAWGVNTDNVLRVPYSTYSQGIYSILSFLSITIFALRLSETDEKIQEVQAQLFKKVKNIGFLNQSSELNTPPCFVVRPAFTLTGWRFFNFSRSFILSSIGNLLTYTLLITQIQLIPSTAPLTD